LGGGDQSLCSVVCPFGGDFSDWGVSKLNKNRGKRSTSFQKKKHFFCEKEAKSSGGCQN
jgi:hypothetical protein